MPRILLEVGGRWERMSSVSHFSDVDAAPDAERLVAYLDDTDHGLSPIKSYMAATDAVYAASGRVLDVGCGVGHDLARLTSQGITAIGLDASAAMLGTARRRLGTMCLLQGDAAELPFRTSSLDGCRIERVLQHVESPAAAVAEIARIVKPGGFIVAFDTDFGRYRAESDDHRLGGLPGAVARVRHPNVGGEQAALIADAGFEIRNVVTELSHAWSLDRMPTDVRGGIAKAVADGSLDEATGQQWIEEQERRTTDASFRGTWAKVLVTAIRS
jgi:ubiquinone/menaquinone biosynthesis C-methylase UbiE